MWVGCVDDAGVFVDLRVPSCVLYVAVCVGEKGVCVFACMCAHVCVQQILIFQQQQKLKPMSLKCQPSAASQVYLRYRKERGRVRKGSDERNGSEIEIYKERGAMKDSRNTKAGEMKRDRV